MITEVYRRIDIQIVNKVDTKIKEMIASGELDKITHENRKSLFIDVK